MPTRLKDIALDLGVSVVTVSKVLRNHQDISSETRSRVLRRMKELNYQPNMMARGLASGRTYTIGLVVPDLVHPFFAEFAKSLGGVLRTSNRALILASSEEDPDVERQEIRTLLAGEISDEECIQKIQQATRRYAKRQLTWFRRQHNFTALNLSSHAYPEALELIAHAARLAFAPTG